MTKTNPSIIIWLFSGCLLIFIMVIIGGLTRLTGSGLSMVDWNLVKGIIPPLTPYEWQETFNLYKRRDSRDTQLELHSPKIRV